MADRDAKKRRDLRINGVNIAGREMRIGALLAGALLLLLIGWLVFHDGGDDGSGSKPAAANGEPAIATADELREIAGETAITVYWAGEQEDTQLEVTDSGDGERVFVRYLSGDAEAGDERADFL